MLNISKTVYVGYTGQYTADLQEAKIVPVGDTTSELKKIERISNITISSNEFDNIPLPGFTLLGANVRRYDTDWPVIDPRGFIVRITQANLANILTVSGITEGLIQERCVWARHDSDTALSLVPVSSSLYSEAVDNTVLLDTKVDFAEVEIGDSVLLQNKLVGVYMGVLSLYSSPDNHPQRIMKPRCFLRRQVIEVQPGKFHYKTDVKILKILKKASTPSTREASVKYIDNLFKSGAKPFFTQYDRFTPPVYSTNDIKVVSTHAVPKLKIELEEITRYEMEIMFDDCKARLDSGSVVLKTLSGDAFVLGWPWMGSSTSTIDNFTAYPVEKIESDRLILATRKSYNQYSLDDFDKFYKVIKIVKPGLTYI
jgi:hypothetical protein